jgi:hypothetical protein
LLSLSNEEKNGERFTKTLQFTFNFVDSLTIKINVLNNFYADGKDLPEAKITFSVYSRSFFCGSLKCQLFRSKFMTAIKRKSIACTHHQRSRVWASGGCRKGSSAPGRRCTRSCSPGCFRPRGFRCRCSDAFCVTCNKKKSIRQQKCTRCQKDYYYLILSLFRLQVCTLCEF